MKKTKQQKAFILILFLFAAVFSVCAQEKEEKIIADETTGQEMKTVYKITSDNYFIPLEVVKKYGDQAKTYIVRNKTDRNGKYAEYIFYFPIEMKDELDKYIVALKRPEQIAKD